MSNLIQLEATLVSVAAMRMYIAVVLFGFIAALRLLIVSSFREDAARAGVGSVVA
jgi:hypothetical protein